ncbi:hypothetical protein V9T40_009651 [Parthenolecanium corni]|uniref:Cas12f1-like TNB domain-containing protein n=1 Tax=Parthenolecanium corni TaxID=536013 RepID=A0AAN9Y997_9HEMI
MCKKLTEQEKIPNADRVFTPIDRAKYGLDYTRRTPLLQYVRSGYATNFETNAKTHFFARVKHVARTLLPHESAKVVHKKLYDWYFNGTTNTTFTTLDARFPGLPRNGAKDLGSDVWRYVHVLYRMQIFLIDADQRSFRLFPIASVDRKHCCYDAAGVHELIYRLNDCDPTLIPSQYKHYKDHIPATWRAMFDLGRFEAKNRKVAGHLKTNGIAASFVLEKGRGKKTSKTATPSNTTTMAKLGNRQIVAVDPGARVPLVCYERTANSGERYSKLSEKEFYFLSGAKFRADRARKKCAEFERKYAADVNVRKPNWNDGRKYEENVKFFASWFERRWRIYGECSKLVRDRTFDAYTRQAKAFHKVADKLFPSSDGDTAIWYGRGASFMNVSRFKLKGVAKFSHDRLLAVLRQKRHIRVEEVDEAYMSKRCAECWQRGNKDATVKGPSWQFRRHRYVHCPMCRTSANRDYNAAKNIYTKTRLSKLVGPSP